MASARIAGVSAHIEERTLQITLHRIDRGNALDASSMRDMVDALSVSDDFDAVLITGSGKHFCSGVDLTCAKLNPSASANHFYDVLAALLRCPRPVIASINGSATGLGWLIAACSDMRIAGASAAFQFPELRLGIPAFVAVDLLRDQVSPSMFNRTIFQGEAVSATMLFEDGWLDAVCAPEMLIKSVEAARSAAVAHPRDAFGALKAHKNAILLERVEVSRQKSLDAISRD